MPNTLKIDVNASVTSEVKIKPDAAIDNLCIVGLTDVIFDKAVFDKAKEGYEFAGMEVPRIYLKFKQFHSDGIERFYTHTLKAVVSVKNSGEVMTADVRASIYTSQFALLRHIHDAFSTVANFNALDKTGFKLPNLNMDLGGQKHLTELEKWYTALVSMFTGTDGKPVYLNAKGNPHKLIGKFILNGSAKSVAIPQYINDGFIEMLKVDIQGKPITALEIKPSENVVFNSNPAAGSDLPPVPAGGAVDFNNL